jgi:hypothetical protein
VKGSPIPGLRRWGIIFEANSAGLLDVEFALGAAAVRRDLDEMSDHLLHTGKMRADLVDPWARCAGVNAVVVVADDDRKHLLVG